jgi:RimJ/RimL family protein N-acetyltransferase
MSGIPSLKTARLLLRPFAFTDAADVQRLAGEFSIADTTLAIPHPYEDGMAEQWIAGHDGDFKAGKRVAFAITNCSDGLLLGAISLMNIQSGHQAELGYWIGKPFWNKGFCTEAGKEVLKYAFLDLALIRVYANHFSRNPASGKVIRKLGFTHEGSRRQQVRKWDKFEDDELYGLLKQDWQTQMGLR